MLWGNWAGERRIVVITPAFQAGDASSILVARSRKKQETLSLSLALEKSYPRSYTGGLIEPFVEKDVDKSINQAPRYYAKTS